MTDTTAAALPPSASPLLQVRDLRAGYGAVPVLQGISFDVHAGEIVTLIGSNGAGKTTVLNTLCGIVRATSGSILLYGEDITHTETHLIARAGVAHVPEGRRLFQEMTVLENLQMGAYIRRDKKEIAEDLDRMFTMFPRLHERRHTRSGALSGGEQQMCAMARGLMARPRLLMLDEPSLGLSPKLVEQIFDIIADIHRQGVTVLLVEQNAQMALAHADRGYALATGEITLTGTGQDLLHNESVRKLYLGED